MTIEIEWTKDEDGWMGEFNDLEGTQCRIREDPSYPGDELGAHLVISFRDPPGIFNREHCAALWPLLKRYAETGTLREDLPDLSMKHVVLDSSKLDSFGRIRVADLLRETGIEPVMSISRRLIEQDGVTIGPDLGDMFIANNTMSVLIRDGWFIRIGNREPVIVRIKEKDGE